MRSRLTAIGPLVIVGLFFVGIVGCGEESKPNVAGSSRSSGTTNLSQTALVGPQANAATNDDLFSPEATALLQDMPGALVYLQGDTLNLLKFDDELKPIVLAEDVIEDSFEFNPTHTVIIYESDGALYSYRLTDDEPLRIGILRFGGGRMIESWSPNEEWFIRRLGGTRIYNIEGLVSYDLGNLRLGNIYQWTTDNQVLIIDDNGRQGDSYAYTQVTLFELPRGGHETIEVDLDAVNSGALSLEDAVSEAGYEIAPLLTVEYPSIQLPSEVIESPSIICNSWAIADGNILVDGEIIYQSPLIYMLSELSALSADDLLFLKWTVDDCGTGQPETELVHYRISTAKEEIVAEGVFPDNPPSRNEVVGQLGVGRNVHRYAVSPDGQFIVWLGGGIERETTSLNLFDLTTGRNAVVMERESSRNINDFVNNQLLLEVYWLNP